MTGPTLRWTTSDDSRLLYRDGLLAIVLSRAINSPLEAAGFRLVCMRVLDMLNDEETPRGFAEAINGELLP